MNELLVSYIEDLRDNVMSLNEALMKFEKGETDSETVDRVFRVAHTIKGNSAAMEFTEIAKVMHAMEDILHQVREGSRCIDCELVDVLFDCHDFLEDCIGQLQKDHSDGKVECRRILDTLSGLCNKNKKENKKENENAGVSNDNTAIRTQQELSYGNMLSGMPLELWEVLEQNVKRGHGAYLINIEFKKSCRMKSVRAWMIFQYIEANAALVYSQPERPTETEFKNGEFKLESDEMIVVVLSEKDPDELTEELNSDIDIKRAIYSPLNNEQISGGAEKSRKTSEIMDNINEVEIELLDIEKTDTDWESVDRMIKHLHKAGNCSEDIDNIIFKTLSDRLKSIISVFKKNKKKFASEDVRLILDVVEQIKKLVESTDITMEDKRIKEIQNRFSILKESLSKKERIGEKLVEKGVLELSDIEELLEKQKNVYKGLKFGQVAVKEKKLSASMVREFLKEQDKSTINRGTGRTDGGFIRVPAGKVDNLLDMLGELLILNSQLEQQIQESASGDSKVMNTLSRAEKVVQNIQDISMSLRLIEIKNTLHRLTRIARDTASDLGKKVIVNISGEETEIDRNAAEKLFDPLMHLVRNAVSHGIEDPDERKKKGKSPEGTVTINAYSKRGNVYVEVIDDGRGINTDIILRQAIEKGMAEESRNYSREDIIRLIYTPGFSTQNEVNSVSGRGVGMNVVESEIKKMGGKVDVSSQPGKGSSFILRIPINLALVNGTVIETAGERYIIPTLFIKEFLIMQEKNWLSLQGKRRAVKLRERIVPVITAEQVFQKQVSSTEKREVVILEMGKELLALPVSKIVGRQEVVSKSIDSRIADTGYIAGASILGDGRVCLILDVEALFKQSGIRT